jgi:excisionase family DNA binding protein
MENENTLIAELNTREALLSIKQAAAFCATTKDNLYDLISEGKLPAVKLGNRLRIDPKSLSTYLTGADKEGK